MDASDMPPAPAEPLAWPCLTDPVWALHEALQLQVPADVLEHPELNRSVQSFGLAATSFAQFDAWLTDLGLIGEPSGVLADLRLLWHRAHHMTCAMPLPPAPGFPPPAPAAHTSAPATQPAQSTSEPSASWQETFPAKLSADKTLALKLKQDFLRKYPSEVLDDSSTPSSRLLALAFKQASGTEWRFIPWKWRLSSAELEDMRISRPRKLPRMELADLLLDEVPARSVPDTLGMFGLSKLLRLHSVAMAMVADVHLATLKAYEARFLRLASARFEAGSGLRAPNALECEQADKRFWECVSELRVQGWCLDDALHELRYAVSFRPCWPRVPLSLKLAELWPPKAQA